MQQGLVNFCSYRLYYRCRERPERLGLAAPNGRGRRTALPRSRDRIDHAGCRTHQPPARCTRGAVPPPHQKPDRRRPGHLKRDGQNARTQRLRRIRRPLPAGTLRARRGAGGAAATQGGGVGGGAITSTHRLRQAISAMARTRQLSAGSVISWLYQPSRSSVSNRMPARPRPSTATTSIYRSARRASRRRLPGISKTTVRQVLAHEKCGQTDRMPSCGSTERKRGVGAPQGKHSETKRRMPANRPTPARAPNGPPPTRSGAATSKVAEAHCHRADASRADLALEERLHVKKGPPIQFPTVFPDQRRVMQPGYSSCTPTPPDNYCHRAISISIHLPIVENADRRRLPDRTGCIYTGVDRRINSHS